MGFNWVIRYDRDYSHVKWKVKSKSVPKFVPLRQCYIMFTRERIEELEEWFPHVILITYISNYINLHQYLFTWETSVICEQLYLTISCIVLLYRTSTWSPAVREDNFSSSTAIPTVLKLRQSNQFLVVGHVFNLLSNAYPSKNE